VTHTATLDVPADIYDEALAFCNARLAEDGKPPIDALPAGKPGSPTSCPCGAATGAVVWFCGDWWWPGGLTQRGGPSRFTNFFDANAPIHVLTLPVRVESPR
jgi:hypothetical protein